ncbi:hypothetical protein [Mycobacteroides abscessus]|uniref:hypothetical protein n=2 Tax=Mycobacteroides abscessus TaxID=36809 RepID=UPI00092651F5|nr:hypothetical protein [Mycobacteroides abscessus]MBL3752263.1 hypothetical protein [Mycobacteroides abscessus subsp. massiliense]SII85330.1 Uncharacterised protein [Mycobacteroides abscessus subsp. abscessus]SIK55552.1 Uncharacterised protein [Mycobacteroides abscessus subsp. abscessus]SIL85433.1 Uncharacterised protein [Mycobacteroides abscessus subsp. abscessus]SIM10605.1 Uncharacterised protein [Mycobacteroides abscessus subsp. abscessus]
MTTSNTPRTQEWIVHPNRSAPGRDEPGRNGHYRSMDHPPALPAEYCVATIALPKSLRDQADPDGTVRFEGSTWRFVVAAARSFAVDYLNGDVLVPFGFQDNGRWWWWDGTTTDYSILETLDAQQHVRRYLEELFPEAGTVTLTDSP